MSSAPSLLTGIGSLASRYDVLLCDVWGVVHNGVTAYPAAVEALRKLRALGKAVILITNAPRPGTVIEEQIARYSVPRDCYDTVVASGDVARDELRRRPGAKVFHLGPERDLPNYEGLDVQLVGFDRAEIVVCTGFFNDEVETPEDYREMIGKVRERNMPFICANPDIVVERGDKLIWCAGAIARLFEQEFGGTVVYAGKPHAPIYELALARAANIRGAKIDRNRVLAVGDGVRTDLAGAVRQGFDCVFVADGIHAAELNLEHGAADLGAAAHVFAEAGGMPVAVVRKLSW